MSFKRTIQRSIHRHNFTPWPARIWPENHARADKPRGSRKHRRRMKDFLGQGSMGLRGVARSVPRRSRGSWLARMFRLMAKS